MFPRSFGRGLIEAYTVKCPMETVIYAFPRSFGRGLIEALAILSTSCEAVSRFRDLLVAASLKRCMENLLL